MTPSPDGQAVLTIDCDALAANWRFLAGQASPAACAAAVKADAYGTGIAVAVPTLARAGCRTFFVAHVAEGVLAREALRETGLGDAEARIFVLNGFHPFAAPLSRWRDAVLRPVVNSWPELAAWTDVAGTLPGPGAALQVDTGMNRVGLSMAEAAGLTSNQVAAARAELLISHFLSADQPDDPINAAQIARFEQLRQGPLGALPASLANSAGILLPSRPHYDLVRPGFGLYGGNPRPAYPNPMQPVVSLHVPILQIRDLAPGDTAGYGGAWTAQRPTRLATLGIGYADGLPRNARTVGKADGPFALVGATCCPLVGRISMDLTLVDVTDAPADAARPGAPVELLGRSTTVDDLADACGTVGYEVLTRLGRRFTRRVTGWPEGIARRDTVM